MLWKGESGATPPEGTVGLSLLPKHGGFPYDPLPQKTYQKGPGTKKTLRELKKFFFKKHIQHYAGGKGIDIVYKFPKHLLMYWENEESIFWSWSLKSQSPNLRVRWKLRIIFQEKFAAQIFRKVLQFKKGHEIGCIIARTSILHVKILRALEEQELGSAAQPVSDRTKFGSWFRYFQIGNFLTIYR